MSNLARDGLPHDGPAENQIRTDKSPPGKIDADQRFPLLRAGVSPMGSMQLAASLLSATLGLMPAFQSMGLDVILSTPAAMPIV